MANLGGWLFVLYHSQQTGQCFTPSGFQTGCSNVLDWVLVAVVLFATIALLNEMLKKRKAS